MGRDGNRTIRRVRRVARGAVCLSVFGMVAVNASSALAEEGPEAHEGPKLLRAEFRGTPTSPIVILYGEHLGRRPAEPPTGTVNLGQCGSTGDDGFDYGMSLWIDDQTQHWSAGRAPGWNDCIGLKIKRYSRHKIVYTFGSLYTDAFGASDGLGGVYGLYEGDTASLNAAGQNLLVTVHYRACRPHDRHREWYAPRHPRKHLRLKKRVHLHAHG
jgi:hypothetical protein